MTETDNRKAEIAEKIRALRAKASDAASTEAEAMEAARLAARLLARYELTEDDVAAMERDELETIISKGEGAHYETISFVRTHLSVGISKLCEVKAYQKQGNHIVFTGIPHEVEMAHYLLEMLDAAAERGWKNFRKAEGITGRNTKARNGYMIGFANRMKEMLKEIVDARDAARRAASPTGTALVLVDRKASAIAAFLASGGVKIRKVNRGQRSGDAYAAEAGARDASRINLSRPVEGRPDAPRAIAAR
jgi:hypothetical protein